MGPIFPRANPTRMISPFRWTRELEEEIGDRAGKAWQEVRSERVLSEQCGPQRQRSLVAAVDLDLPPLAVNHPVLLHSAARVKLEFRLAIALLVGAPGGENFHDQFRRGVQLAVSP